MTVKERLLPLLSENRFISGEQAAKELNVSRAAVWKAVEQLRREGCKIEAVTNKGYRLRYDNDILQAGKINELLGPLSNALYINVERTVTSTNILLKEKAALGAPEGTVLIASSQTSGRGRFARKFYSPENSGIYMSILLRPRMPAENAVLITTAAAAAVAVAAENLSGKKTEIKWVNDVLINGKKICGILTEAALDVESGSLDYAVLGIGINAYTPSGGFPEEIKNIAGAVFEQKAAGLRNRLAAEVLKSFYGFYSTLEGRGFLEEYRRRSAVIGKRISVISRDGAVFATALGIDENCRLQVKYDDGRTAALSSGEISTKIM